jgi:hypothetical protein
VGELNDLINYNNMKRFEEKNLREILDKQMEIN